MKITERTPFYLIGTIFLFITICLSFISAFHATNNGADFFPNKAIIKGKVIHDKSFADKLCWYFSQLTHHTIFLLFTYFVMALLNIKSDKFFKMVAPLALTISVLYFYFLYPRQKLKIHQLSFSSFFSHFMIIFLVFGEFMYIPSYELHETTNCFVFILSGFLCVTINYLLRGVWSYNLIKLDQYSGWKLIAETILIMYSFSMMFYLFKYKKFELDIMKSGYFISSMVNLIYVLCYLN